jgi:hypothetical protein
MGGHVRWWVDVTTVKTWIRGIGIVTILVGGLSLPVGIGISPERDTSIFHNFADLGIFIDYGLVLIVARVVLLVLSLLFPSKT